MELAPDILANHRRLSRTSAEFLRFVERHPECLERASFRALDETDFGHYRVQSWPAFVGPGVLREAVAAAAGACRLVRAVPGRVFGDDYRSLARFYDLDPEHARLIAPVLKDPAWIADTIARPDLVHTASGFKVLELNMAGNIGGWEPPYWAETYRSIPVLRRFLDESGAQARPTRVLRNLLLHILRQVIRKFRRREIHIAITRNEKAAFDHLIEVANEEYSALVEGLGLSGSIVGTEFADLVEENGSIRLGGRPISALVEIVNVASPLPVYRAWTRGTLLLYNGPAAPVLTDKRTLALVSEMAETGLLDGEEKEIVRRFVPWTRRVSPAPAHDGRPELRAREPVSTDLLLAERPRLVLKPGPGMGGEGVTVGHLTSPDRWRQAVARAWEGGDWVVQELAESLPYLHQEGDSGSLPHSVIWCLFIFGTSYGGCCLKMAPTGGAGVVNAAQGGTVCTLFEVEE